MVQNFGLSFGIPVYGWWWQVIMTMVILWLWSRERFRAWSGLVLVLMGGLINLYQRVFWGSVLDNINLPFINLWFNLADILITIGCIVYIWQNRRYFTKTQS